MHPDHYTDLMVRAAANKDYDMLRQIGVRLAAAEVAHEILRAKKYGVNGMMIDDLARQVPDAK